MANILFRGSDNSVFHDSKIEVFCNKDYDVNIIIYDENSNMEGISLDVPTAIQLSKELRKSIAIAKKQGGYDE